jgi:hypothetical protein
MLEKGKLKLISVTERDHVNEFIYKAELTQQKFEVGIELISRRCVRGR